jgi:hypothetical protein
MRIGFFMNGKWDWGELYGRVTRRRAFDYLSFRQRARGSCTARLRPRARAGRSQMPSLPEQLPSAASHTVSGDSQAQSATSRALSVHTPALSGSFPSLSATGRLLSGTFPPWVIDSQFLSATIVSAARSISPICHLSGKWVVLGTGFHPATRGQSR